jgi:hypothetical protein
MNIINSIQSLHKFQPVPVSASVSSNLFRYYPLDTTSNYSEYFGGTSATTNNSVTIDGTVSKNNTGSVKLNNGVQSNAQWLTFPSLVGSSYTAVTISYWVNFATFVDWSSPLALTFNTTNGYMMLGGNRTITGTTYTYVGFYDSDYNIGPALSTNTWYHLAFVLNTTSTGSKIYINGTQYDAPNTAYAWRTDQTFAVRTKDAQYGSTFYPDCHMSDLRFYNTALSQSNITDMYNDTTARHASVP